jgi:hypothetical protein
MLHAGTVDIHLTLHSLLCLAATVVVRLHYEVVEVLHNIFELCLSGEYGC